MKVLVVGAGLQGRAVLHDLARSEGVEHIVAVDRAPDVLATAARRELGTQRVETRVVDAHDVTALALMLRDFDVAVEMLPADLCLPVAQAALSAGVHLVNCHYAGPLTALDAEVSTAGLHFLPEAGLDPGLDLILAALAVRALDEVHELQSYGAGFPEPTAATGPLRYKVTWSLEGVLRSYVRPARLLDDGAEQRIAADEIFQPAHIHTVDIPGVGILEAYPNGDAIAYAERLGIAHTVRSTGRYVLRWPGHAALWHQLVGLGLLEREPLDLPGGAHSPLEVLARILEPRLRYGPEERDVAIARVEARGLKDGRRRQLVCEAVDRRDLTTGLFAMNRLVGFTASIAAQLVAAGHVERHGVLSPAADVAPERFVAELERRGVKVSRETW